jgi:hypothetical protein
MRQVSRARRVPLLAALLATLAATTSPAAAQGPPAPAAPQPPVSAASAASAGPVATATLAADDAASLARLTVAIAQVRDSAQKQLALVRHKSPEAQRQLRAQTATQIAGLLQQANLSEAEYRRRTYLVSTDSAARRLFDATVATLSGATASTGTTVAQSPTAAAQAAPAATAPVAAPVAAPLPAGPLGAHLGHVLQAFGDTPDKQGLLPTALAEARTAATHAGLAARDLNDLAAMQLHAGHVLHAVDPAAGSKGPGLGYGVKRAAEGVAAHVEMAGAAPGAAADVTMHAMHVATAARTTVSRTGQIASLVKRIQDAKSASDASSLVSQLVSLANELTVGRDADADGRFEWKEPEGGLQQADEHVKLLVAALP